MSVRIAEMLELSGAATMSVFVVVVAHKVTFATVSLAGLKLLSPEICAGIVVPVSINIESQIPSTVDKALDNAPVSTRIESTTVSTAVKLAAVASCETSINSVAATVSPSEPVQRA